ncbi:MAG: bifunctional hydroxymethylpyrimidine kinase/phosphomethylpyrimidine kinase [Roseiarcus sp.]
MRHLHTALSIAGSDSGGGAGIQADLKTFAALGVHGATAITAITVQNTLGVRAVHALAPEIVAAEIAAVLEDFEVAAIKIGMLAEPGIVEAVARELKRRAAKPFVVYDPVLAASSGDALARVGFVEALPALLPLVDCLTPNLGEAAALLGAAPAASEAEMRRQGERLIALGPRAVLMKGGHLDGGESVDWLVTPQGASRFAAPRSPSHNLHGTGCTLSSAIAAFFVRGHGLADAVAQAKAFVGRAIEAGRFVRLGAGCGPLAQLPLL